MTTRDHLSEVFHPYLKHMHTEHWKVLGVNVGNPALCKSDKGIARDQCCCIHMSK